MTIRSWTGVAALLLLLGVMSGAFGAHALKDVLDDYQRSVYEKAVFYHFVHALGLLMLPYLAQAQMISLRALHVIGTMLLIGICLFSGSLYLLAISGERWLGMITPFGGISFMLAWALLAWHAFKRSV